MIARLCCLFHAMQLTLRHPELLPEVVTIPEKDDCGRTFEEFLADWSAKIANGKTPPERSN